VDCARRPQRAIIAPMWRMLAVLSLAAIATGTDLGSLWLTSWIACPLGINAAAVCHRPLAYAWDGPAALAALLLGTLGLALAMTAARRRR
jgi:hypothetical protein